MSTPELTLISFALCPYVQRALCVMFEKNIPHEIKYIDLNNPPLWFLEISPLEKVPVLLVNKKPLFESIPICEYIDDITPGSLYPTDPFIKAQNKAWIEFANVLLQNTFTMWTTHDEIQHNQARGSVIEQFETLDEFFTGGPFFNGDTFSLVDAVYSSLFRYHTAIKQFKDFAFYDDLDQIKAWSETLLAKPSVIKAAPDDYYNKFKTRFTNFKSYMIESR